MKTTELILTRTQQVPIELTTSMVPRAMIKSMAWVDRIACVALKETIRFTVAAIVTNFSVVMEMMSSTANPATTPSPAGPATT